MIIGHFDVAVPPFETDSVLVVYADTLLTPTIARELFQPQAGKSEIAQELRKSSLTRAIFWIHGNFRLGAF